MISLFEPDLEYILSRLSHREILEHYTGTNLRRPIRSPFREDRNPTISFKEVNDRIIWKDWKTGETGDGITWVMKLYNLSFKEAIKHIYNQLLKGNTFIVKERKSDLFVKVKSTTKKEFIIKTQRFSLLDYKYWKEYGISLSTLKLYNVYSVYSFYMENNKDYVSFYSTSNIIYGYKFYVEGDERWKIYMPYKGKKRFLYNGTNGCIEGYDQLPLYGRLLIITKSMKDVMLLHELGYNAISLQGEANMLSKDKFDNLTLRFDKIITLYDSDEAGIAGSERMKDAYDFDNIYIPKYTKEKDISDVYRKYGYTYTRGLLKTLIKC